MSASEADVRRSLGYAPWSCGLCPERFHSEEEARIHFAPTVSDHPGQPFSVSEAIDVQMELKVREALTAAEGGQNTVANGQHTSFPQTRAQAEPKGSGYTDSSTAVPALAFGATMDTGRQMSTEEDVRRSLGYAPWSCNVCPEKFHSEEEARIHFAPTVSDHPGQDFSVSEAIDVQMELKVRDIMKAAAGAQNQASVVASGQQAALGQKRSHEQSNKPTSAQPSPTVPVFAMSNPTGMQTGTQMSSEEDVRRSLGYAPWSCNLCPEKFHSEEEARIHFAPTVSDHPGHDFSVSETMDIQMEVRVRDAMRAAAAPQRSTEPPPPQAVPAPSGSAAAMNAASEEDIRRSFNYAPWTCNLCPERFFSEQEARIHFNPMVSSHPGQDFSVSEAMDISMEMNVREAMRQLAGQGPALQSHPQLGSFAQAGVQAGGWQASSTTEYGYPLNSMAFGHPQVPFDRAPTALPPPTEADIRRQLNYAPWTCNLCPEQFYSDEEAQLHFNPMVSSHPGQPFSISEALHIPMEMKVREAMKRALGSSSAETAPEARDDSEGVGDEASAASGRSHNICAQCSTRVGATRWTAMVHVRQRHLNVPPFVCKLCDYAPPVASKAKLHAINSHAVELNWERSWVASPVDVEELAREFSRSFPGLKPLNQAAARALALAKGRAEGSGGPTEAEEEDTEDGCADQPSTSAGAQAGAASSLVACRQCGRTVKDAADPRRHHVQMHHARLQRYQCRRCPFKQIHPWHAKSHAMTAHEAAEEGWEAAFDLNPRDPDETRRLLHHCF